MSYSSFTKTEISTLFKQATMRVRSNGLRIMTAPTSGQLSRILMIASRKTGNAPQRNLFKRRLRSLFREEKFFEKKVDFIVITDKTGAALPFQKLKELFSSAFERSHTAR